MVVDSFRGDWDRMPVDDLLLPADDPELVAHRVLMHSKSSSSNVASQGGKWIGKHDVMYSAQNAPMRSVCRWRPELGTLYPDYLAMPLRERDVHSASSGSCLVLFLCDGLWSPKFGSPTTSVP